MSSGHLRVVKRINAGCGWPSVNKLDRSLRVLSGVGGLLHVVIFGELFPLYSNKASASLTSGLRSPPIGDAYQAVIPDERTGPEGAVLFKTQHEAVGKDSGFTAHIERFNNTIRQRLARFVRKTLSFSKSDEMHLICLHLFLHRYNLERLAVIRKWAITYVSFRAKNKARKRRQVAPPPRKTW